MTAIGDPLCSAEGAHEYLGRKAEAIVTSVQNGDNSPSTTTGLNYLGTVLPAVAPCPEHIYSIADNHAQTVEVCVDRLQELGANEHLKRLTGRLQKLATEAALGDGEKSNRQPGRSQS
jgi:hypothetical protein